MPATPSKSPSKGAKKQKNSAQKSPKKGRKTKKQKEAEQDVSLFGMLTSPAIRSLSTHLIVL